MPTESTPTAVAERPAKRLTRAEVRELWLSEPEHPEPAFDEETRYIPAPAKVQAVLAHHQKVQAQTEKARKLLEKPAVQDAVATVAKVQALRCLTVSVRPMGRTARPASNARTQGSRRRCNGSGTTSSGEDDPPSGEDDPPSTKRVCARPGCQSDISHRPPQASYCHKDDNPGCARARSRASSEASRQRVFRNRALDYDSVPKTFDPTRLWLDGGEVEVHRFTPEVNARGYAVAFATALLRRPDRERRDAVRAASLEAYNAVTRPKRLPGAYADLRTRVEAHEAEIRRNGARA